MMVEKRRDGFWYVLDDQGFVIAEIKGPNVETNARLLAERLNCPLRNLNECGQ